jgi:hypothetical protein
MPAIGTQEVTFGNFDESQAVSEFEIGLSIDLTVHVELYQSPSIKVPERN